MKKINLLFAYVLCFLFAGFIAYKIVWAFPPSPPAPTTAANATHAVTADTATSANALAVNAPVVTNSLTATGGNITNTPISGSTGSFTNIDGANVTINQGAEDGEIIALKSSDVSHSYAETGADTFAAFIKTNATKGGLSIKSYTDTDSTALTLMGNSGVVSPTTSVVVFQANRLSVNTATSVPVTAKAFSFKSYSTVLFQILGSGDLQLGSEIVTPSTALAGGIVWGNGTAANATAANAVQMWVADYLGTADDARLHIIGESSSAYTTVIGSGKVSITGSTGGLTRKMVEASANITGTTVTITLSIPVNAKIIGADMRVDAALAAGETWDAAYSGGNTQTIAHEEAVTKDTKIYVPFDGLNTGGTLAAQAAWASPVTTNTTNIAITKHGGGAFTAQGNIRAWVYYENFDTLANSP